MPTSLGPAEILVIFVVALIVLGPKRLPEAGRALGRGLREFKDSVSGLGGRDDDEDDGEPSALPADRTAAPR